MRLDFLQNYPTNSQANQILISLTQPNLSPIDPEENARLMQDSKTLATIFGGEYSIPFGFLCAHWTELFLRLAKFYKIACAISNHQQSYEALKLLNFPIHKLIPNKKSGLIEVENVLEAIQKKYECFIIPLANEDILTRNPIEEIKLVLKKHLKKFVLIVDISYASSLNLPIPDILDAHTLFLLNGESLGVLRSHGVIIAKNFFDTQIFPKTLPTPKLFASLIKGLKDLQETSQEDSKNAFYQDLKEKLKDNLNLFAPLENTLPNSLPLRFASIKARNLLQALLIQKIYAINGTQCLYGFFSPSFVLQEMGYTELEARELLSVSYKKNPKALCETLAQTYHQIRTLEI
ncbi:hypothetical protein BKH41_06495 [Helicobacter sp. 12S02232-10]|uniref:nitrogen fixation protein NifS n=1 Tax=Helicobacter sp. 12S02232-10 TaxID=1476197 RepID=UPI000BA7A654|nr:nitrogen fixation protein NifS [Helicobacter sp. 12S02232-10]PAF47913.1 hypothetical protein BKH41_06495 [Helicobacter sp. 12S02232-10]